MATGRIILPALAWAPLDSSAGNLPATLDFVQSSGGPPGPRYPRWHFQGSVVENICVAFRMPDDYASDPVFKIDYMTTATGYSPHDMNFALAAISADEAIANKAFDTLISNPCHGHASTTLLLQQEDVDLSTQDDDLAADDLV